MGLPRLGGQGGNGGDVWVVATKNMTLKRIKDKYPQRRFVAGAGANSRFVFFSRDLIICSAGDSIVCYLTTTDVDVCQTSSNM